MRLRVILEDSAAQCLLPNAEVLHFADGLVSAIVWTVNPNIPLGSPAHLAKLATLLSLGDVAETNEMSLFSVVWTTSTEWRVENFLDPARSPYQLQLRDDASVFLTRDPCGVLLSTSSTPDGASASSLESKVFWVPLLTSALCVDHVWKGDGLHVVGSCDRRVWKQGGDDTWSLAGTVAVFGFPSATTAIGGNAKRNVNLSPGLRTFHWCFRVGFEDPQRTGITPKRHPEILGNEFFAREEGKHRGSSTFRQSPAAPKIPLQSSNDSDSSVEEEEEHDNVCVGDAFPAVLLGFALRGAVDDAEAEAETAMASTPRSAPRTPRDGASTPKNESANKTTKVFELSSLSEFCCVLDSTTGCVYHRGGEQGKILSVYTDLDAYICRNGMILSFSVDAVEGVVNIRQDERLVLVATLPARMREELLDAHNDSNVAPSFSNLIVPLVQVCSRGTFVDVF